MQGALQAGQFEFAIQFIGFGQGGGVQRNHRVQRRAAQVKGFDAIDITLHHSATTQLTCLHGCMHVGNRSFDKFERLTASCFRGNGAAGREHRGRQQGNCRQRQALS